MRPEWPLLMLFIENDDDFKIKLIRYTLQKPISAWEKSKAGCETEYVKTITSIPCF